jgi:hypothetical protein
MCFWNALEVWSLLLSLSAYNKRQMKLFANYLAHSPVSTTHFNIIILSLVGRHVNTVKWSRLVQLPNTNKSNVSVIREQIWFRAVVIGWLVINHSCPFKGLLGEVRLSWRLCLRSWVSDGNSCRPSVVNIQTVTLWCVFNLMSCCSLHL